MTSRRGAASVAELILVFWLFGFVLLAAAVYAAAHGRLAATQQDEVRRGELVRTARVILGSELRALAPADVLLSPPDSVRVRAVRGSGGVCAAEGGDLFIRYRGMRSPDPRKDSLLLVGVGGAVVAAIEESARSVRCGDDGYRLRVRPRPVRETGFAMVFEPGTYVLSGGAVRYRRGAGGRQPLTEALLQEGALVAAPGGIHATLLTRRDSLPWLPHAPITVRLGTLNPRAGG